MARGEIFVASAALLLLCLSALVNGIDAENLFPTYEDNAEEQARVGVISLTGSTSNTTLNLSGLVILGLSLSAAVSFWAYTLSALEKTPFANLFNNPTGKLSPSSSSLNYTLNFSGLLILGLSVAAATMFWAQITTLDDNKLKRSLDDSEDISLPIVLNNIQRRFENARVFETNCRQRIICEIGTGETKFLENSFGQNVNTFFGLNEETLKKLSETDKWAKTYLAAWNEGKRGKMCKVAYDKCSMTRDSIDGLIGSE